jgi:flagellar motor switch protein FliN/FliY
MNSMANQDQDQNLQENGQIESKESAASERVEHERINDLFEEAEGGESLSLELILDIPLTISVEIGRTEMPIQRLLQLTQGAVIELDKMVGEPMDVLVNGTLIAQGEVVVIDDQFGIRLTQIVSPSERIRHLR